MDYGQLIGDAWALTWRYKFLWVLGSFAAGPAATCSGAACQGFQSPQDFERDWERRWDTQRARRGVDSSEVDVTWSDVTRWLEDHLALVLVIVGILTAFFLLFLVLHLIAAGGIARATSELGQGRAITLGQAWRAGVALVWRYAVLLLLQLALIVAVAGLLGALSVALGLAAAGLAGLLVFVASVPVSIVVSYAQISTAAEDRGPVEALRAGYEMLRARLGPSLLIWFLGLVLVIVAGIAATVAFSIGAIVLLILGLVLGVTVGGGVLVGYVFVAVLLAVTVILLLVTVSSTFMWSYWALAYLRLSETGRLTA